MMKKNIPTIVAIGGGELKALETLAIDRSIVSLTGKKKPRVLFIPTASGDAVGYWESFQNVYGKKLKCQTEVLFLIRENCSNKEIKKKIFSSDIIYVGGGNTLRMLKIWRKKGVDVLLQEAYKKGIVLSGLSAGAICWFRYGASDSRKFMKGKQKSVLMRVRGLNIIPCTVSPHHIREKELREKGILKIMKRTPGVALALDDNAAICIQGDEYKIITSRKTAKIQKFYNIKNFVESTVVQKNGKMNKLLLKSH